MYKFICYKDESGEWRWNLVAGNGEKVADSGEGYTERNDCVEAIARVSGALRTQHPITVECDGAFFTHV